MNPRPRSNGCSGGTAAVMEKLEAEVTRSLADQALVGVAILDGDRLAWVNARFAEIFGYRRDEMLAFPTIETVAYSSRLRVTQYLRECLAGSPPSGLLEYEGIKRDDSPVHLELSSTLAQTGEGHSVVLLVTDITPRKLAERKVQALNRRIAELAVRDPLTGLYNLAFTEASLERELYAMQRSNSHLSLVSCDLDGFRSVNDTLGREAGDQVLKAFGALLLRRCRKSDIACRCGGEEFLVVFPGMSEEVATRWAEQIRAAVAGVRVTKDSVTMHISASFGVATYPQHGRAWQELIDAVDAAQYSAKVAGGNLVRPASPPDDTPREWHCVGPNPARVTPDLAMIAAREG